MACRGIAASCLLLFALAGCGSSDSDEASKSNAIEQFGFIRDVDTRANPPTLVFDEAEWLTGEAAQKAAQADGAVTDGEKVPNDYYMRNTIRDERVLKIAPDAQITAIRCPVCRDGQPGKLQDFLDSFRGRGGRTYSEPYRGSASQYWLTIQAGRVIGIDEQYRP
jgi:hypothetical protein